MLLAISLAAHVGVIERRIFGAVLCSIMLSATDQGTPWSCKAAASLAHYGSRVASLALVQWRSPRALLQASHPHGVHRFLESLAWRYPG